MGYYSTYPLREFRPGILICGSCQGCLVEVWVFGTNLIFTLPGVLYCRMFVSLKVEAKGLTVGCNLLLSQGKSDVMSQNAYAI